MKSKNFIILAVFLLIGVRNISAQNILPPPSPSGLETSKLSELLSKNLERFRQNPDISRERREQAYAKLLEGQRYIWNLKKPAAFTGGVHRGIEFSQTIFTESGRT